MYDIARGKRIKEYRYDDTPFGNSGVAQNGGYFLGINYGRLARLRPVTGYPGRIRLELERARAGERRDLYRRDRFRKKAAARLVPAARAAHRRKTPRR